MLAIWFDKFLKYKKLNANKRSYSGDKKIFKHISLKIKFYLEKFIKLI